MSDPSIQNLRIRFYGVQGSGSIFPSREERATQSLNRNLFYDSQPETLQADKLLGMVRQDSNLAEPQAG